MVEAHKGGLSPSTSVAKERFLNCKAESYWHLRKLFEDGKMSILSHRDLVKQLALMRWEMTSSEKIKIVDPSEKSPDFSDSLNIAVWVGGKPSLVFGNLEGNKG